jgi:hypothetical protein
LKDLPNQVENTACVLSIGLTLRDSVHFDAASEREYGKRYAAAAMNFLAQ